MRKILAVLLSTAILLGTFALGGCGKGGKDDVFDDKYEEISYQEFCDYAKLIENNKDIELEKFCVKKNEKEVVKVKHGNKKFYTACYVFPGKNEENRSYYFSYVDGALRMQGNSEINYKNNYNNSEYELKTDYYYEDGIIYSIDSETNKGYKNPMYNLMFDTVECFLPFDELLLYKIGIVDLSGESRFYNAINSVETKQNEDLTVSYSICKKDKYLKYKVETTEKNKEDNFKQTTTVSVVSVYELKDSGDYRFIAGQYVEEWNESRSYNGFSVTVKTSGSYSMSLESYDGSVDIPQDVKSYEENENLSIS